VQVVRRIDTFEARHDGAFQVYLRQALLNRIRDEIRRAQRHPAADPLDTGKSAETPSPLEEAIGAEALQRYESALQCLKVDDRDVIILRVELGLSHAEIADAIGKPSVAAAHMAVSRALVRLAKQMARV
jgi:RNA polymerase sigma-70 factor (ECF subfamily)